jgi:hypothetical protein
MQFIGVDRPLDMTPIRCGGRRTTNGSAQLTPQLHLAEQWRIKLVADDDALSQWLTYPATDSQQLRADPPGRQGLFANPKSLARPRATPSTAKFSSWSRKP